MSTDRPACCALLRLLRPAGCILPGCPACPSRPPLHPAPHPHPCALRLLPGRLIAWGEDTSGNEKYTLHVRDLASGKPLLARPIPDTAGEGGGAAAGAPASLPPAAACAGLRLLRCAALLRLLRCCALRLVTPLLLPPPITTHIFCRKLCVC